MCKILKDIKNSTMTLIFEKIKITSVKYCWWYPKPYESPVVTLCMCFFCITMQYGIASVGYVDIYEKI